MLLHRFQSGDRQAFEAIYQRHVDDMTEFAVHKLASLEEARDVVHDLFVELWTKGPGIRVRGSLSAYLFTAIRYKVIDRIRRNIRQEYYTDLTRSLEKDIDDATSNSILYNDLNRQIEVEIDSLPPKAREIFRLNRQEHMSIREIAQKMQISDQTVKNQLGIALKRLRVSFEKLTMLFLL